MTSRKFLIIIFLFVVVLLVTINYLRNTGKPVPNQNQPFVKIGDTHISVEVMRSAEQKAKGLSGRTSLAENAGMLFVFSPKQKVSFWMIDMHFPIDIIWIADGKIIGIEKNAPAPEKGTPNDKLPLYYSPSEIDHVLEVNSGFSEKHSIKTGDSIKI